LKDILISHTDPSWPPSLSVLRIPFQVSPERGLGRPISGEIVMLPELLRHSSNDFVITHEDSDE
jgi:hypothetical protein